MRVMPGANTGFECGRLHGMYPHRMGQLFGVDNKNGEPSSDYWALDNGVFGAWKEGREWSSEPFYSFLERYAWAKPQWVACPDWVGDRDRTLELWEEHRSALLAYGVPIAFVVQDGMESGDVPSEASVIFVGGSTEWKWRTLDKWCQHFPRVHVGRVNTHRLLWQAHEAGAESCDGTGWFRGDKVQLQGLYDYLRESEAGEHPQRKLAL